MKALLRKVFAMSSARDKLIRRFAKRLGLVYFGSVDQRIDDHDVIRGLTTSTTHKDSHYAVGSYDGYDISIVDRYDTATSRDGAKTRRTWVIMRIDLESAPSLPHLFLRPLTHAEGAYDRFFTSSQHLIPINTLFNGSHHAEFHGRYEVYTLPSRVADVEAYLTPEVSQAIAARLWPHAVELVDNRLYIYTTDIALTDTILNTALESGLWLARIFDRSED